MRSHHPLPNTFLTQVSPLLPQPTSPAPSLPPPTTLAHIYAHIHATATNSSSSSSSGSGMWRHDARPPLAHARSVVTGGTEAGITEELHTHYSMIAVVVLTALFFTITISATGVLLAFCKKNNAVFSLHKGQGSNYEMDDMDKDEEDSHCQDDDDDDDDDSNSKDSVECARMAGSGRQKRSHTFPDLANGELLQVVSEQSAPDTAQSVHPFSPLDLGQNGPGRTPLMKKGTVRNCHTNTHAHVGTDTHRGGDTNRHTNTCTNTEGSTDRHPSVTRSVTVAAIHHTDQSASSTGSCGVTILVEDFDSRSEVSDSAFEHLYLKLQEDDDDDDDNDDEEESEVEDVNHDQTRALLK